jgi:hypothetical protein
MADNKPRPLGTRARQIISEADMELAAAYFKLRDAYEGTPMLRAEVQLVAAQTRGHISEARRLLVEAQKLGTGPLKESP